MFKEYIIIVSDPGDEQPNSHIVKTIYVQE
jgi:hypothetical protein